MSQLALLVDDVVTKLFPIVNAEVTIGRSPDCDIRIEDPSVSLRHAVVKTEPNEFLEGHVDIFVIDLDSKNGTFVNGNRVNRVRLHSDDVIAIGWNRFKFIDESDVGGESTVLIMRG